MNILKLYFSLFCLLFVTANTAFANPENKEIILSFSKKGWPPFLINSNKKNGILLDILNQISDKHGYKVIVKHYPGKRGTMYLKIGQVDARPKAKEWVANPDNYIWTDPVIYSEDVLVMHKDSKLKFRDPKDLIGKIVVTIFGYKYPSLEKFFNENKIRKRSVLNELKMLEIVKIKYADAAIMNKLVALWLIKQDPTYKLSDFKFSEKPLSKAGYRIMFTKKYKWQPFVDIFNDELAKMKERGMLADIIKKYIK